MIARRIPDCGMLILFHAQLYRPVLPFLEDRMIKRRKAGDSSPVQKKDVFAVGIGHQAVVKDLLSDLADLICLDSGSILNAFQRRSEAFGTVRIKHLQFFSPLSKADNAADMLDHFPVSAGAVWVMPDRRGLLGWCEDHCALLLFTLCNAFGSAESQTP